jgi:uncharacterized lipoprotein YddW (UPF0748 family)
MGSWWRGIAWPLALVVAVAVVAPRPATVSASSADAVPASAPQATVRPPKRQLRGVWLATVSNINWPSRPGLPAQQQKAELTGLFDQAKRMGMNAVFVQVRPTTDAFYPTPYAPWSEYLTGAQGTSPGYDPLAFMVDQAHARNLELHAWFNPYRVSLQPDLAKLAPSNPARVHPHWVRSYGGQLWFDPGIPALRRFLENSILDAVRRYDIDGVHVDDYFYPYPVAGQTFDDAATYQRYGGRFATIADWRRDNVNLLVSELDRRIHATKPWVKFGISPFGVWRNEATDPSGSDTQAGVQDFDDLYADTRTWIRHGWIDYIAPQVYWNIGFPPAAYDTLVHWWAREVAGSRVALYIGQAAYKIGHNNPAWNNPDEMPHHLALNAGYPAVEGDIYFHVGSLIANPLGFRDRLIDDLYRHPALVPVMPSLGGRAPRRPEHGQARRTATGVLLTWAETPRATYYAVYRFEGRVDGRQSAIGAGDLDATHLLATVRPPRDEGMSYLDGSAKEGTAYTYYVTALDRLHHESRPSRGIDAG